MKKSNILAILTCVCGILASSCSDSDSERLSNYGVNPEYSVTRSALEAKCDVTLLMDEATNEMKTVQFETDYLPNVTYCELPEALNSEEAYISGDIGDVKPQIEYTVKAGDDIYHPVIAVTKETKGWVELGEFELTAGELQYVELSDKTDTAEEETSKIRVIYDAIRVQPQGVSSNDEEPPAAGDQKTNINISDSGCSVGGTGHHSMSLWVMMAFFGGILLRRKFTSAS